MISSLKTSDFDYMLPEELIAQTPLDVRDRSRLMLLNRAEGSIQHHFFYQVPDLLCPGDVLIFNNSRVIRARLFGTRLDNNRKIEILLLRRLEPNLWETLMGSRKRVEAGLNIEMLANPAIKARVAEIRDSGIRVVRFSDESALPEIGEVPLPPYIHEPLADPERYQTVYADEEGSAAAPTAGLHFTPELLQRLKDRGIECLFVTLHVGLNTFRPVKVENILEHPIHAEYGVVDKKVAAAINRAKSEGRRVICVGTTSVRLIESAARASLSASEPHSSGQINLKPFDGWADLFIYPGYRFQVIDGLVTNFHLPRSTLLMLVSAFAGKDLVFRAYHEAIQQKYRFYSFGDAMLIV